ncbi:MAG TPA: lysophospholipid acyltransferase family protein [Ktedonobacteraceae bacterium]|nr:lysophospholipid acyltransferase family protein [Ktedonobacteraceae bacterium]
MSLVYRAARGAFMLAKWTPPGVGHQVGSIASALTYAAWREKRLVTQRNMAQVSGLPFDHPRVRHLALASWYNYGRLTADFLYFPYADSAQLERDAIDMTQGTDSWRDYAGAALKPGRGAILLTAHFGNWDYAGAILTRSFPLSAVAEKFNDEQLNALLQSQRIEKGVGIIPMEGSARRILRVLQQNLFVAIVADRPVSAEEGVPITFFGRKTYVPAGPAALALKAGAALMPGFAWYGSHNRFYLRAFPPVFPEEVRGRSKEEAIICLTQRAYEAVEEMVREWPTQWYMFRPFWPEEAKR